MMINFSINLDGPLAYCYGFSFGLRLAICHIDRSHVTIKTGLPQFKEHGDAHV